MIKRTVFRVPPRCGALGLAGWIVAVLLAATSPLVAQAPPPDGNWLTVRTEHFRVTFQPDLEPLARHAAEVAERTHAILAAELAPEPYGPIELVITDHVDVTNANATPFTSNRVVVFARPPLDVVALAYGRDWIELAVVHELVHIFHLDDTGLLGRVIRAIFGRVPALWPVFPAVGTPGWNVEGLATHYESRLTGGGRIHGSYHDMVIRTAALEADIPDLEDVSTPSPIWPAGRRSYIYGGALMRWLAETEGNGVHRELIDATGASLLPTFLFFDNVAKRPTHDDFEGHYDEWRIATRHAARDLRDSLRAAGITESEPVIPMGPYAVHPRTSPDGRWLAYAAWDFRSDPAVRLYDRETGEVATLARQNQAGRLGPVAWLPDGSALVVAQLEYDDPYRIHSDLYLIDAPTAGRGGGGETRLTRDGRLSDPDVASDGRRIAAVANRHGALDLAVHDMETGRTRTLVGARPGEGFAAPRWSPDGRRIASTRFAGGWTDVVVVDVASGDVSRLTADAAIDGSPAWSPDGRYVLFWSDRSGIPNLYAAPVDDAGEPGNSLRQITSVLTGAVDPDISPDGRWIHFSAYHHDGWHIERIPYDPGAWREAPESLMDYHEALLPPPGPETSHGATDVADSARARRYNPLPSLRPFFWLPYYAATGTPGGLTAPETPDDRLRFWGVQTFGWDVLRRHSYTALFGWDFDTDRPLGSIGWTYQGLGNPVIDIAAGRDWRTAGSILTADGTRRVVYLREDELGIDVTVRRRRWRDAASLTVGGDRVWREYELHERDPAVLADPNTELPDLLGAFVQPGFANYRVHPYSISREDGVAAFLVARRWWADGGGVQYDQLHGRVATYLGFAGWGYANHVLAGRISGLLRSGPGALSTSIGGAGGDAEDLLVTSVGGGSLLLPVRGFREGARGGTRAWTASAEYRFPLWLRGLPTSILGLSATGLSGTLFADAGDAWCPPEDIDAAITGCDLAARPILASAGAELNFDIGILHEVPLRLRGGVAMPIHGTSSRDPVFYLRLGPSF